MHRLKSESRGPRPPRGRESKKVIGTDNRSFLQPRQGLRFFLPWRFRQMAGMKRKGTRYSLIALFRAEKLDLLFCGRKILLVGSKVGSPA